MRSGTMEEEAVEEFSVRTVSDRGVKEVEALDVETTAVLDFLALGSGDTSSARFLLIPDVMEEPAAWSPAPSGPALNL